MIRVDAKDRVKAVYGTQTALAARIGASTAEVSRWLSGAQRPSMDTLDKLCEALNCQPGDLLVYVPESPER